MKKIFVACLGTAFFGIGAAPLFADDVAWPDDFADKVAARESAARKDVKTAEPVALAAAWQLPSQTTTCVYDATFDAVFRWAYPVTCDFIFDAASEPATVIIIR